MTAANFTPNEEHLLAEEEYRIYDILLAVTLSLCTVVGLPGNLSSLVYFYSASRRDFSSLIYTLVCGIDICTCVIHLPVMIALYNTRKPGIFGETTFCIAWIVVFYYLQKISMFLVMLLSVSRTITIIYLRYKIKKRLLVASCVGYTLMILLWEIIVFIFERSDEQYGYYKMDVYCYRNVHRKPIVYIHQVLMTLSISVPPILTSISFTVFANKLLRKRQVSNRNDRKHQAAVTMAMFTALFLVCNLPCLMNNVVWLVHKANSFSYPGPLYSTPFIAYYSWLISDVVSTVLNAALNPVLYLSRMSQFREWLSGIRSKSPRHDQTGGSFQRPRPVPIGRSFQFTPQTQSRTSGRN